MIETMIKVELTRSELNSLIAEYEEKLDWCVEECSTTTHNYCGVMALMQTYKDRVEALREALEKDDTVYNTIEGTKTR